MIRGWRTPGFWFSVLSMVIAGILRSGVLGEGDALKALGAVQASLTAMGYGWSRCDAKKSALAVCSDPNGVPVHRKTTEHILYFVSMAIQLLPNFGFGAAGGVVTEVITLVQAALTSMGFIAAREGLHDAHKNAVKASEAESIRTEIKL